MLGAFCIDLGIPICANIALAQWYLARAAIHDSLQCRLTPSYIGLLVASSILAGVQLGLLSQLSVAVDLAQSACACIRVTSCFDFMHAMGWDDSRRSAFGSAL